MSLSDPIGNMLTSIRNANMHGYKETTVPASKVRLGILEVLKSEGFIEDFEVLDVKPQRKARILMKYGATGDKVIHTIKRVSKPGRRVYKDRSSLRPVRSGFGIDIISTSKGIISDKQCRKSAIGGEVLCTVF